MGLLFAGSLSDTIANPICAVLSAPTFNVSMVGSGATGSCPSQGAVPASAQAPTAKRRNEEALLRVPAVVGVGVGAGPAIEVYLARDSGEARGQIPAQLDGVPVRVLVTGEFHAR